MKSFDVRFASTYVYWKKDKDVGDDDDGKMSNEIYFFNATCISCCHCCFP